MANAVEQTPLTANQATRGRGAVYGAVDAQENASVDSYSLLQDEVSYRRLIKRYLVVVPLTCFLSMALVVVSLYLFIPRPKDSSEQILQLAVLPFIAAAVTWTAAHAVKSQVWSWLISYGLAGELVSVFLHVLLVESLRLAVLVILKQHHQSGPRHGQLDSGFFYRTVWVAIGWASAEVLVGIKQGYQQLQLYLELFGEPATYISDTVEVDSPVQMRTSELVGSTQSGSRIVSLPRFIEDQLDGLLRVKELTELEEVYGIPIPEIPIFITTLQRIDSLFVSLGLTLLLSSSLISTKQVALRIIVTSIIVIISHCLLSILWTPRLLPRIGVHTAAYVSFMASIACIWAGLWRWGIVE